MLHGLVHLAVGLVPFARAAVQLGLALGLEPPQLAAQRLAQEPVEAERVLVPVEWQEHHVPAREIAQHPRRAVAAQHRVAGGARQPVEHGLAPEEGEHARGDVVEQLVPEVGRHDAVLASEPRRGVRGAGLVSQRDGREVETRRPALRPVDQGLEVGV